MYLTNFDNRIGLKNIVNKYLKGKYIDVCENIFSFEKFIKSFVNIDRKINIIIENYQPKTKIKNGNNKKIVISKLKTLCLIFILILILLLKCKRDIFIKD